MMEWQNIGLCKLHVVELFHKMLDGRVNLKDYVLTGKLWFLCVHVLLDGWA